MQLLPRSLGFFGFFGFSMFFHTSEGIWASGWAASGLGGGLQLLPKCFGFFVFLGFLGFPMDLLSLCARPWMTYTIGESSLGGS